MFNIFLRSYSFKTHKALLHHVNLANPIDDQVNRNNRNIDHQSIVWNITRICYKIINCYSKGFHRQIEEYN